MYHGERFNSMSHALGAALAACGGVLLVTLAVHAGDTWKTVGCCVFALTLLTLYLTSTFYHSLRGAAKDVLRKMDHCAIYLLIAGTYTPFALVTLRGPAGWTMFGVVWALALVGILQELRHAGGTRILSLLLYLLMGWLALLWIRPLIDALGRTGFAWLVGGGVFYTVGVAFYATDHKVRNGHGIWHLFVLAGSTCHYLAVLFHVV